MSMLRPFAVLGIVSVGVLAFGGSALWLGQGVQVPRDAISREITVSAGSAVEVRDVISREVTVHVALPEGPGDVISREVTVNAPQGGVGVENKILDVVSREVSVGLPTPNLVFDPSGVALPNQGLQDQVFEVRWRVRNDGPVVAEGPWTDQVEFSTSIRLLGGGSGTKFNSPDAAFLAPGQAYDRAMQFLMPQNVGANGTQFTIRIHTDVTGVVFEHEGDDGNTFGPHTVSVSPLPKPNLRVLVTQAPAASVVPGGTLSLAFRVWNDGVAATYVPQWNDRIALVPAAGGGGAPTTDTAVVASRLLGNLGPLLHHTGGDGSLPGSSYLHAPAELTLPLSLSPGTYYAAVRANVGFVQPESNANDNLVFSGPITVEPLPLPDLEVFAVAIVGAAPGTALPSGAARSVEWRVRNLGPGNFYGGQATAEVWISSDDLGSGADALGAGSLRLAGPFALSIPPLAPGQEAPATFVRLVVVPATLHAELPPASPENEYWFKVLLAAGAQEETVGSPPFWNNLAVSPDYSVTATATPDLYAAQVGLVPGQGVPQVGHPMQVRWKVESLGASVWYAPLTWRDRLRLMEDPQQGTGVDLLLGEYLESASYQGDGVWALADEYHKTLTATLPTSIPAGIYHLVLTTDAQGQVPELGTGAEDNNRLVGSPIAIERNPADLSIVASAGGGLILPSAQGAPGQTIQLPWTVTNGAAAGATSASSWVDRVVLSESNTGLVNPRTLVSVTRTDALQAGGSYSQVRSASVPFVPAGSYWLHFRADTHGAVFEDPGTLGDNLAVVPFLVTAQVADLVVDQVAATQRVRGGEPIAVSWTVRNDGAAATGATGWIDRVHLSDLPDIEPPAEVWVLGSRLRSGSVGAGASYSSAQSFSIPLGLDPGPWFVVVRTDAADQVFELEETNNTRNTRTWLEIEPPPPGGGGGGGGSGDPPGSSWLPANLVPRDVQILNGPVTAGQTVQISWELANEGPGATDVAQWSDRVYLSLDGVLDATDQPIGHFEHGQYLDVGETMPVFAEFVVPLSANGNWVVLVKTDFQGRVFQDGATSDDVAASAALLQVVPPPLVDLTVDAILPPQEVLLGAPLHFTWTTRNDSPTDVLAAWGWRDNVWLVPEGGGTASPQARFLGQIASDAGVIGGGGGTHVQDSQGAFPALTVPGIPPGPYRVVAQLDALGQIAELDETNNVGVSVATVELKAIELPSGDSATIPLPGGTSRWFRLAAPADLTLDLEFEHTDTNARCELYVRETAPPELGVYDLSAENLLALDPSRQAIRIPRTSGEVYYVLARAVTASPTNATLTAHERSFTVDEVAPQAVGAGRVTLTLRGSELWNATSVELRPTEGGAGTVQSTQVHALADGSLLALFDLAGAPLGPRQVFALKDTQSEASWAGTLDVEAPAALAVRAVLELAPTIRRGESGDGLLRLVNVGNVDVPYSLVALGHAHQGGFDLPEQRVILSSPSQDLVPIETTGERDSLVVVVEDLAPGREHVLPLTLAVGAEYPAEGAAVGLAARAASAQVFRNQVFAELSQRLRVALVADATTPALLTQLANDPFAWNGAVAAGVSSGAIVLDWTDVHLPDATARSARDLLQALADGLESALGLPSGVEVPPDAIVEAAREAWCAPFAGSPFDCEVVFPLACAGEAASAAVTAQAGLPLPSASACTGTPAPDDPNEKLSSRGIGPQRTTRADQPLNYEVHFENQESATAWASRVVIRDPLQPGLRSASVRFHELRLGESTIAFPPGTHGYIGQELLTLDGGLQVLCQISALVDAQSDTIQVVLQALDPATGLPSSAGDFGLLPPSVAGMERRASGYIAFNVRPDLLYEPGLLALPSPSARVEINSASIQFNYNPPLWTNVTGNQLDGRAPVSTLSLDDQNGDEVELSWSASDEEDLPSGVFEGTGVHGYSLYVGPTPSGPWTALLLDSPATSRTFRGALNQTYYFKVEATDGVGNVESKGLADLAVEMPADCDGNGIPDSDDIASEPSLDSNQNGVMDACECLTVNYCVAGVNSIQRQATISSSGLPSLSGQGFTLTVQNVLPVTPGLFFYGTASGQLPFGDGYNCVSGAGVVRLLPPQQTTSVGSASLTLDFGAPPIGSGPGAIPSGGTRYFQFWYRDPFLPGGSGFNLSDGLQVTFCD